MAEIIAQTYEIVGKLGAGGGGTAYLANHLRLNKRVVLKADKRKITTSPELLRREVDILKNLSHPFIPQVYDFFSEDATVYTVMDYIEGESLDLPLKRGERFSQAQVIHWGKQVLEALCYLHAPIHGEPPRGFVHSDVKPANIMWRTNGNICLIDYNIALAIGEENVVGGSAGYASPEHYGLDYSSGLTTQNAGETAILGDETATVPLSQNKFGVTSVKKLVVPDARSDIYSVGATLYHLLSGHRPAKSAMDVVPLSPKEFSPALVAIVSKAMSPNPEQRYQTAEEMLQAFRDLHKKDPRAVSLRRAKAVAAGILSAAFVVGGAMTFTGLRQMERAQAAAAEEARRGEQAEQAAKTALAAVRDSEAAYQKGDIPGAKRYALAALSEQTPYHAQGQKALTDALGVYDMADGVKAHCTVELPSEALKISVSPEGSRTAALYAYSLVISDTESGERLAELPTQPTAVSDFAFINEDVILCAGLEGLSAYNIPEGRALWTGDTATRLAVSEDGSRVVGVDGQSGEAKVYGTQKGELIKTISFQGRKQTLPAGGGILSDPEDALLSLNSKGTLLAASFEGGGLCLFEVSSGEVYEIMAKSEYSHFEGGFSGKYFAFSAWNNSESIFLIYDAVDMTQIGGFSGKTPFRSKSDDRGICVSSDNLLVELDPTNGEQKELAYTSADIIAFQRGRNGRILVATKGNGYALFNENAQMIASGERENGCELLGTGGAYVVLGSLETPTVQVLKMEAHEEAKVCSYDPAISHEEARLSADGMRVMLFRYDVLYVLDKNGTLLEQVEMPDSGEVYDQQYRRDENGSYLEVTWNDGTVRAYSAQDGGVLWEKSDGVVNEDLHETFETARWRVVAPLHGAATVYDKESGEEYLQLEKDSYLTYVTEVGEYIVTQYVSAQGEHYGLLLNQDCETLAYLPGLCDVVGDTLVFDDHTGNLRQSPIYSLAELKGLAANGP